MKFTSPSEDQDSDDITCTDNSEKDSINDRLPVFMSNEHDREQHKVHLSAGDLSGPVYMTELENSNSKKSSTSKRQHRFSWHLLINPVMLQFGFSLFVYCLGVGVVYQCLPPLAEELGVSKSDSAIVLATIGAAEIPFRILNGYLADKHIITAYTQYTASLFMAGFMVLIGTLLSDVSGLAAIIVIMLGMSSCGSTIYSLIPVVFGEILGPQYITDAMGLVLMFQSASFLVSSLLSGVIYEHFGTLKSIYYYISMSMAAGSFILWPHIIYRKLKVGRLSSTSSSSPSSSSKSMSNCDLTT